MKQISYSGSFLFTLLLFSVFSAALILLLLFSANAYQNSSSIMERQYSERTCLSYLSAKIRGFDQEGGVSVGQLDGAPALILTEEADHTQYHTYLYYYNGFVCELYAEAGLSFALEDGLPILPLDGLSFQMVGPNLIHLQCTDHGRYIDTLISIRSGRAELDS